MLAYEWRVAYVSQYCGELLENVDYFAPYYLSATSRDFEWLMNLCIDMDLYFDMIIKVNGVEYLININLFEIKV